MWYGWFSDNPNREMWIVMLMLFCTFGVLAFDALDHGLLTCGECRRAVG
jgi:hypothetical protein